MKRQATSDKRQATSVMLFTLIGFIFTSNDARAGYLIDPSGGTAVFSSANGSYDDSVSLQSIGFTGHLFGTAFSQIYVSTNGNLNLNGTGAFTNSAFPSTVGPMIAGLWDDLFIFGGSGENISEKTSAGNYFAVTFNVSHFQNNQPIEQFQIALFGATTTIGSFTFQADDIALSYQAISGVFNGNDATVGLNSGNGTTYATIPGVSNGLITDAQANLLPTSAGSFILFRPNGGGGYNVSIQNTGSVVPEPSSFIMLGIGIIGLGTFARRRLR